MVYWSPPFCVGEYMGHLWALLESKVLGNPAYRKTQESWIPRETAVDGKQSQNLISNLFPRRAVQQNKKRIQKLRKNLSNMVFYILKISHTVKN